jgi:cytochrome P450
VEALMLHHVKDLSPEQKLTVESLLGHPVSEDESVSIKSFRASEIIPSGLSDSERREALQRLEEYFVRLDSKRKAVDDEEADEVINEEIPELAVPFRT